MFDLVKLESEQLNKISILDIHASLIVNEDGSVPELLKKLSDEKLLALVDVSSWNKDRFDPQRFSSWLEVFMRGLAPLEAGKQIKRLDRQELQLFIYNALHIDWYDPQEIYEGDPFISPDNTFIMFPKDDGDPQFQTAVELIKLAYMEDEAFGRALCLDSMTTIYSMVEDESRIIKEARLSDEGIPSYMDALDLFHFEDPTNLLKKIIKKIGNKELKKQGIDDEFIVSEYAVVPRAYWTQDFGIDQEMVNKLQTELSAVLTASIVVNNVVGDEPKHIKDVIERSKSYFSIGLELLGSNIKEDLSGALEYIPLRDIFRLGFSLLVDIRNNATKIKTGLDLAKRPDILDADEEAFIKALLLPIPMYQPELTDSPKTFEKLEELKDARKKIADIASRFF